MNNKETQQTNWEQLQYRIQEYCRSQGMGHTGTRHIVARKLLDYGNYVDAAELWLSLREEHQKISISSVYLALKVLVNSGIAQAKIGENRSILYTIAPNNLIGPV